MEENFNIPKITIPFIKGINFSFPIKRSWIDDDDVKTPIDMAGCTAYLNMRDSAGATGTPLMIFSTSDSSIIIDNSTGTIGLAKTAAATLALTSAVKSKTVGDLILVQADGITKSIILRINFEIGGIT